MTYPEQSRMCSMRNLVDWHASACRGLVCTPGQFLACAISTSKREAWEVDSRLSVPPGETSPATISVSKTARASGPWSSSSSVSEQESLPYLISQQFPVGQCEESERRKPSRAVCTSYEHVQEPTLNLEAGGGTVLHFIFIHTDSTGCVKRKEKDRMVPPCVGENT